MTEQEAKTKWCPMVRFEIVPSDASWLGIAYTNRGEQMSPPRSFMCIASDCMMWREYQPSNSLGERDGFCGLGGKE